MPSARSVRPGFFPLDEELQLLPGQLTPALHESLVRLGTWMPFARAATELGFFTHVHVGEATARRVTETAGAAYVAVQTEAVERLERELPPAPDGPALQLLSVDGAMVPLVHREWAEVKTLVVGGVAAPVGEHGERVVHSHDLSYFSRLTDADTFGRLALVETHRRGTERAGTVCAVTDGAEWAQGFIDLHRPDAVRILDFPHAAAYVAQAGQVVWGEATEAFAHWLKETLHELKHGSAEAVLQTLRDMHLEISLRDAAAATTIQESLNYLEKRRAHLDYARFQASGYPIGSGSVESANKLVVEARLKGAGMHWARPHVDPMLALRTIACSDRWEEAWPLITQCWRRHARAQHARRHSARQAKRLSAEAPTASPTAATPVTPLAIAPATHAPPDVAEVTAASPAPAPVKAPYRPAPNHPWRRMPIGRARYQPAGLDIPAKN
jgi:hypothetical protein